jgi:hypothetical protein
MGFLVPLTLFGWIPFVLFLFLILPPRRAVIASFLIAWLFLPMAGYKVGGMPDYTKMSATVLGVLMSAAIFDTDRLLSFRLKWIDLPMVLWCTSVMASSYANGLGIYDGCSEIFRQVVTWGLPYIIGRIYFSDLEGIRELAIGLFVGGLIYVPLCLLEVRLSPQLHLWVYGFRQHSFAQNMRDGGYRPMVFMQHGLMVAMWMGMTSLVGVWLWKSKVVRQIWDIPMSVLVASLCFTIYLCKSQYALLLFVVGVGTLYAATWLRTKTVVLLLLLIPPTYMVLRAEGIVTGETLIVQAKDLFGEERSKSLAVRINNENALSQRAMEKPWFGWGGWGGARVAGDDGKDLVTDSLWIITIGKAGWVGLGALTLMLLLPMILVCYDWRIELWTHPMVAPVVVLGMMTSLYMFDHLMNGMVNPIFMLAVGAVSSAHYAVPTATRRPMLQTMHRRPPTPFQPRPASPQGFRPA